MDRLQLRNHPARSHAIGVMVRFSVVFFFAAILLGTGRAPGQTVDNTLYLRPGSYAPGTFVPQAAPIPGQMIQQAMAYGSPLGYQHRLIAAEEPAEVEVMPADGEVVSEGGFFEDTSDSLGLVRVWANGVRPRIITSQRYSDHYWQVNVDFLALERYGPRETITTTGSGVPLDLFKRGATTGGTRISAKADLFYSFDLEFAWLGGIHWVGRSSNQFPWDTANGGQGQIYPFPSNPVMVNANNNFTNINSNFNAFELNTRWRWVQASSPWTGAWILGVRYIKFAEKVSLESGANTVIVTNATAGGAFQTALDGAVTTEAINHLVGLQGGGELFWAVCRGVMIGGDLKGGIYGNSARNKSTLTGTSIDGISPGPFSTSYYRTMNTAAFFGEANVMVNAHLGHNWYIRGGYTGIFLTDVTTGVSAVSQTNVTARDSLVASGFYGGLEWQY